MKRRKQFGPNKYVYRPARVFIGGPEMDPTRPIIHLGGRYACPMCDAEWDGHPIGTEEISAKELAKRSKRSQARIDHLISSYRIAANLVRPRRIPILRFDYEEEGIPDEYTWCPLCGATWATGSHWVGDGYTMKEIREAYGVSVHYLYQLIRNGELRVLWLRNQSWWSPRWEVLSLARDKGWPEDVTRSLIIDFDEQGNHIP